MIPLRPKSPISLTLTCHGWDPQAQSDVSTGDVLVGIWLSVGGSTGRVFERVCYTPQELWDYVTDLTEDPLPVLQREFQYTPPREKPGKISVLPADLKDLFK